MAENRGVVYLGPGQVEVQEIKYPKLANPEGKRIDHAAILKAVSTNICGSDQPSTSRSSRWTTAPKGYANFDKGAARKFVLDPHGMLKAA